MLVKLSLSKPFGKPCNSAAGVAHTAQFEVERRVDFSEMKFRKADRGYEFSDGRLKIRHGGDKIPDGGWKIRPIRLTLPSMFKEGTFI
jgi:hypothetical protein